MKYCERVYRNKISGNNLTTYQVTVKETDLYISSDNDLRDIAIKSVYRHRNTIEEYIKFHPEFSTSLIPVNNDELAPPIIKDMIAAARISGVGPMAAVAGAIAEYVGLDILQSNDNVIVENGGDIFLNTPGGSVRVGIFAGESPLSNKITLKIEPEETPLGICTSSATVGHSLSFGKADAVCVKSKSAALADAAATSICNLVKREGDIKEALDTGSKIEGVLGIVIIAGKKMGASGDIELV
ncbi:MAG: UPF0280 family protein [Syntrophaceae bacterium]|nr:UPF0280 family protein [Syntrophaceae bacterium]